MLQAVDGIGAGNAHFPAVAELARESARARSWIGFVARGWATSGADRKDDVLDKDAYRDHRCDVAARPLAPGESQGVVTTGRRSYRRYGTA
jgi:hypothetical protein